MDLGGPQRVPSLSLSPAGSSKLATGGHGRMQTLGAVLGRHRRSFSFSTTMTNNSDGGEPQVSVSRASGQAEAHYIDNQQKTAAIALRLSLSPAPTAATGTTNLERDETIQWGRRQIGNYVNLDLVRDLIVRHSIELAIILVILIYLVYYFSRISRRPKLIGNKRSNFVASIHTSFKQTIQSRFSPLIYFWGTNPQTALFGYLQGQTSNDEMPRSEFHRQYLYVSDVQYLASNIDLSEHYERCTRTSTKRSRTNHRLCQLDENRQLQQPAAFGELISSRNAVNHLSDNLRLAMSSGGGRHLEDKNKSYFSESEEEELNRSQGGNESDGTRPVAVTTSAASKMISRMLTRTASADCSDSSAIGSSSDSGVFANSSSNSSSFSSSSSDSSLTIDMNTSRSSRSSSSTMSSSSFKKSARNKRACTCSSLYESKLDISSPIKTAGKEQQQQQQQEFKREHFEFGQCALDWYLESHQQYHENNSVALISAGMTTGSDKKYVTDTVQTLHKLGYEVCVFIRRGVGGLKLNSTKFFSPSKWHDFETAILSVKKQRPRCRLVAIGFSFGSIELCRYLAMSGDKSLVASALLISCPFDPEAGGRNMRKRALNRKIDAYLAKNLGKQLFHALSFDNAATSVVRSDQETSITSLESMEEGGLQTSNKLSSDLATATSRQATNATISARTQQHVYANYNGSVVDLSSLPKIKSLVDFEDNYNRVIQNYPNSDAYGADSRLSDQLAQIRTPTLCLSSEDDFMAPVKLLPIKQIEANENLCMILTKRGGHMAFIDGLVWPRKPYFAQRIISEYMRLKPSSEQQQRTASEQVI